MQLFFKLFKIYLLLRILNAGLLHFTLLKSILFNTLSYKNKRLSV